MCLQPVNVRLGMLALVQSRDPDLRFDPVGATPVVWNDAEWLDASRRG